MSDMYHKQGRFTSVDPFLHGKDKFRNKCSGCASPCPECVTEGMAGPGPLVFQEDLVNNPKHYTSHPSGVEVIQITEHMDFCLGNAVKYILISRS